LFDCTGNARPPAVFDFVAGEYIFRGREARAEEGTRQLDSD